MGRIVNDRDAVVGLQPPFSVTRLEGALSMLHDVEAGVETNNQHDNGKNG